jgi:hypothetical protein
VCPGRRSVIDNNHFCLQPAAACWCLFRGSALLHAFYLVSQGAVLVQRSVTRCGVSDILGESSFLNYPRAYMSVWARRQLLDLACTRARAVGCLLSSNQNCTRPHPGMYSFRTQTKFSSRNGRRRCLHRKTSL